MLRAFFRLVAALFKLVFFPLLLLRRSRAAAPGSYVEVEIAGQLADIVPRRLLLDWRQRRAVSLFALDELATEILGDSRVKGLLVHLRSMAGGMAAAQSLRGILSRVRAAGREVVVVLPDGGDTKAVYVATAASRVIVGPQSTLYPLGFAVSTSYFRGVLDKVGVVPEILAHGKYKSAGEQLVRSSMSEPQREQVGALLGLMHETLVLAIGEGRNVTPERAAAIVDGAPYIADQAVAAGLVDGVAYDDELPAKIAEGVARARIVPGARYLGARRATRLGPILPEAVIGVVRVHGAIAHGSGNAVGLATDKAVIRAVRLARMNRRVRGVVLHIDSPGGSALASDRIPHELVPLAAQKPLIACMANVAASGGYYVAAAAHAIVAQPTTITGSIGVVAARVAFEPLLARLGIVNEVVKRGARADLMNPARALTEDERGALLREIEGVYGAFVRVVAAGRKRTVEAIEEVAQGRVWTGRDAVGAGRVDELGGFDLALDLVRRKLGPGAERLQPAVIRPPRRALPPMAPRVATPAALLEILRVLGGSLEADLALAWFLAGSSERTLAWCPVAIAAR